MMKVLTKRLAKQILSGLMVLGMVAATMPTQAAVPPDRQALLLLRVLAYDATVGRKSGYNVDIVIVGGSGDSMNTAVLLAAELTKAAAKMTVAGKPVKAQILKSETCAQLEPKLKSIKPAAVFIPEGCPLDVAEFVKLSKKYGILTFTNDKAMVSQGIAIGIVDVGSKATLLLNTKAAKESGAKLHPALIQIAKVVG